jgi:hypothetical protein
MKATLITNFKNHSKMVSRALIILFIPLLLLNSCDIVVDRNEEDNLTIYQQSNTYAGTMTVKRDSTVSTEEFTLSINSENPFEGSLFNINDGCTWLFSGTRSGNIAQITGTISDYYNGNFNGKIEFYNNYKISLSLYGEDSFGVFSITSNMSKESAIDLTGDYYAEEEGNITITYAGESETQPISGSANIHLSQNIDGTYSFPNATATRSGKVVGNELTLSGIFIIPNSNVTVSKNIFTAIVNIKNPYDFTFVGEGYAEGTYNGEKFICTGKTQGRLRKNFDAIIAILRGFIYNYQGQTNADLNNLQKYLKDNNTNNNILVNCFNPDEFDFENNEAKYQYEMVTSWLRKYNERTNKIVLIGYSAGGNAVCLGDYSEFNKLALRITLDPIDVYKLTEWGTDQRSRSHNQSAPNTRFINLLSSNSTLRSLFLFGYYVLNANSNNIIEGTDHISIGKDKIPFEKINSEINSVISFSSKSNIIQNSLFERTQSLKSKLPITGSTIFEKFCK